MPIPLNLHAAKQYIIHRRRAFKCQDELMQIPCERCKYRRTCTTVREYHEADRYLTKVNRGL